MKRNKHLLLYALLFLLTGGLASCGKGNNGDTPYTQAKEIDGIRYEISVMPLDAYKRQRDPNWKGGSDTKNYLYVKLRLQHSAGGTDLVKWGCADQECYNDRLAFFNGSIREHIYLTDAGGGMRVAPAESAYENGYGISPQVDVVLVFKAPGEASEGLRLVFEDKIYTQQIIKFSLNQS